jgi:hypothetical protein
MRRFRGLVKGGEMENEEKVEETNQEKVFIPYECPPVPQIQMDVPNDKSYELVLLSLSQNMALANFTPRI